MVISGDQQDGRGLGESGGQPGRGVEEPGAFDRDAHARLAAHTGVAVGHVADRLFVPRGDVPHAFLPVDPVDGFVLSGAGQPEDDLDAVGVQGPDEGLAAVHAGHM